MPITAFHGTRYKVDRFSLAHVNRGAGAQASGWGLYFSSSLAAAEGYQKSVCRASDPYQFKLNGSWVNDPVMKLAVSSVHFQGKVESLKAFRELAARERQAGGKLPDEPAGHFGRVLEALKGLRASDRIDAIQGNLYEVEIDAKPNELVDLDLPLGDQDPRFLAAFEGGIMAPATGFPYGNGRIQRNGAGQWQLELDGAQFRLTEAEVVGIWGKEAPLTELTGNQAYQRLAARQGSPQKASEHLAAAGIPGLRLQTADRNDRPFTNYVVFDEAKVTIVAENGVPMRDELRPVSREALKAAAEPVLAPAVR